VLVYYAFIDLKLMQHVHIIATALPHKGTKQCPTVCSQGIPRVQPNGADDNTEKSKTGFTDEIKLYFVM
jgi:hypothetical protein